MVHSTEDMSFHGSVSMKMTAEDRSREQKRENRLE